MEILKNEKEKMPKDYITGIIADFWTNIQDLESKIKAIKDNYSDIEEVENTLRYLSDAYLICVGKMERCLGVTNISDIKDTDLDTIETEITEKVAEQETDFISQKEEPVEDISEEPADSEDSVEEEPTIEEVSKEPDFEEEALNDDFEKSSAEKLAEVKKAIAEVPHEEWEYFVDEFPEPILDTEENK